MDEFRNAEHFGGEDSSSEVFETVFVDTSPYLETAFESKDARSRRIPFRDYFRRLTDRDRLAVVLTGICLAVATVIASICWIQLRSMSSLLAAMNERVDNIQAAEKPYVSLQGVKMINFGVGQKPAFQLQFRNAGKSPARNFRVSVGFNRRSAADIAGHIESKVPADGVIENGERSYTIASGDVLSVQTVFDRRLPSAEFAAFNSGSAHFTIEGQFTLADNAGNKPVERFCMEYVGYLKDRPASFEAFDTCPSESPFDPRKP